MARRAGVPDRFLSLDQHYYYRILTFLLSITKHLALQSEQHRQIISHKKNETYRYAAQFTDLTVRGYEVAAVIPVAGKNAFIAVSGSYVGPEVDELEDDDTAELVAELNDVAAVVPVAGVGIPAAPLPHPVVLIQWCRLQHLSKHQQSRYDLLLTSSRLLKTLQHPSQHLFLLFLWYRPQHLSKHPQLRYLHPPPSHRQLKQLQHPSQPLSPQQRSHLSKSTRMNNPLCCRLASLPQHI